MDRNILELVGDTLAKRGSRIAHQSGERELPLHGEVGSLISRQEAALRFARDRAGAIECVFIAESPRETRLGMGQGLSHYYAEQGGAENGYPPSRRLLWSPEAPAGGAPAGSRL